jgi:hypothetical protein
VETLSKFTFDPQSATVTGASPENPIPVTVHFTDKSTGPVDGWNWSFGDGTESHEQNPTHTYMVTGTTDYEVMLDAYGMGPNPCWYTFHVTNNPMPTPPADNMTSLT